MADTTLATITITKQAGEDEIYVFTDVSTIEGHELPLVEALGMIELAKDTLLRQATDE